MEQIKRFVELVAELRATQREYFATRSYNSLKKSKSLEKMVDTALVDLRNELYNDKCTQTYLNFPP